ncbi:MULTISPECIES: TonB-dependent receptor [unclassified Sphingobium]|uniref:TonB-dependent receptor n=1 Tax=unclassified Sphingobium TaxID=2611147 RepID=UPI0035A63866
MAFKTVQLTLLACASLAAIGSAAPAWAADAPQSAPAVSDANEGDIVVTAQRRSERQVDVPLSLSVLSDKSLAAAGVTGVQAIAQITPGLQYSQTGILTQPTIRGIGTTGTNVGDSANVATYVDGVYQATMLGGLFELNNIDRIEVLKGPQGTLFGRNATGGAIQIYTREPQNQTAVEASAGFGSFNDRWIKAYATGGSGDFAANIAGVYRQDDGYVYDLNRKTTVGAHKTMSLVGKIKWEPSSQTKVILAANVGDLIDNSVLTPYFVLNNSRSAFRDPTLPYARIPRTTSLSLDPLNEVHQSGVSLTAQHDTGAVTFKSVTSYQHVSMVNLTDLDGGPLPIQKIFYRNISDSYSEELTIASSGTHRLNWVGGVFLFRDNANQPQYIFNDAPLLRSLVLTKALGVFGELTFQATDKLSLIAGLRYSLEDKKLTSEGFAPQTPVVVLDKSWNSFTPRFSARYAISDRVNVYATFSQGFKSGAYNSSTAPTSLAAIAAVDPEKVTAYEGGVKIARNGINFNAAVYHYDYSNIQVSSFVGCPVTNPPTTCPAITRLQNAASAKITGVDADLSVAVSNSLRLTASAAYTHARYQDFNGAIALTPSPTVNPVNGATDGNAQNNVIAAGNSMVRQPDYTFSFGANYTLPVGASKVELSGNTYFNGSFYWDAANTQKEPAYNVTNLRATWIWPGDSVRLSLIGTNVFNSKYNQAIAIATAGTRGALARPASIAGELQVKF